MNVMNKIVNDLALIIVRTVRREILCLSPKVLGYVKNPFLSLEPPISNIVILLFFSDAPAGPVSEF